MTGACLYCFFPESRFGGGFYVGADTDTIVAELAEHGNTAKYASAKVCQNIGEIARNKGYNVIKFQSYRGDGINYE